ncbi:MAG TPA: hypothetical protein PLR60_01945 [Syntrophorhabdaceae bacterium]|nr:hypothetical protein [Syntrophorhabdaceae bacterium]
MSVDKIGKIDLGAGIHQQPAHHKQSKTVVKDDQAVVHEVAPKENAAKVSYPPFLPVGDTQSIYKK